jgi:hypothetical protein
MLTSVTPPTIEVVPEQIEYDDAMGRGLDVWRFTVRAYVGNAVDKAAQIKLDTMLAPAGATSVKDAIEAD